MKHLLKLSAFLLTTILLAQNQSYIFNKCNLADTSITTSVAIKPIDSGYIVIGNIDAANGYSGTYMSKLDLKGEEVFFSILFGEVSYGAIYFGSSFHKTLDNNYIVNFNKGTQFSDMNFMMIKFQEDGQVLWTREYERPHKQNFAHLSLFADNGFLIIGTDQEYYTPTSVAPAHVYVIKTDADGEEEWEYIYPANNVAPLNTEQTQDGGFIISGYQYNSTTGYDMYALKIDSQGVVQWEQTYGTQADDGGCRAIQSLDGQIILVGVISGANSDSKLYYAIVNPFNGDVMYSKTHQKFDQYSPGSTPLLLSDDKLALATLSYGPPPIWEVAFTIFNNSGQIIQEIPISSGLPGEDYIRDLEPTPDGGFVLAGFNYTSPQSGWVVKLGPNGEYCGVAPCVDSLFTSTISTPPLFDRIQTTPVTLYPNPAKGSTTITYTLPAQLPFAVVEFYDLQGQKVLYQVLPANVSSPFTQTIDLSGLASGVYVWRLAMPGGYERYEASGKIVVSD